MRVCVILHTCLRAFRITSLLFPRGVCTGEERQSSSSQTLPSDSPPSLSSVFPRQFGQIMITGCWVNNLLISAKWELDEALVNLKNQLSLTRLGQAGLSTGEGRAVKVRSRHVWPGVT